MRAAKDMQADPVFYKERQDRIARMAEATARELARLEPVLDKECPACGKRYRSVHRTCWACRQNKRR